MCEKGRDLPIRGKTVIDNIGKTYYNKVVNDRKHGYKWELGIFFTAADGKAYRTYETGPRVILDVQAFKKKIKKEIEARPQPVQLFEMD